MRFNRILATVVWLSLAGCIPAFGQQLYPIVLPTSAYTGLTTLIPITAADGTGMTSLTDGIQTVSFSSTVDARTVPNGGWATWGSPPNTESSTPRVLVTSGTSLTLTLSVPSHTFGFEIEPNDGLAQVFTAQYYNGTSLLGSTSLTMNWNSGALLAAGSDATTITSVVITAPATAGGFGMAEFRYGTTVDPGAPAPNTIVTGGLSLLLLAAGALLVRMRKRAEA